MMMTTMVTMIMLTFVISCWWCCSVICISIDNLKNTTTNTKTTMKYAVAFRMQEYNAHARMSCTSYDGFQNEICKRKKGACNEIVDLTYLDE